MCGKKSIKLSLKLRDRFSLKIVKEDKNEQTSILKYKHGSDINYMHKLS